MKQAIVIYDSDCGFCKWCLATLLRLDDRRRLRPLPLDTVEADRLLADLTAPEREASWHLVLDADAAGAPSPTADAGHIAVDAAPAPDAPVRVSAGAALAPVMGLVRGGSIPAALFRRFPGASERGYRWVADHRGLLGRFVGNRARRWAGRVIAAHGGPPQ